MASTTTVNGLPYPEDSDANDVAADMLALVAALDAGSVVKRLSQAQINALTGAQKPAGLVVYNTTTSTVQVSNGSTFSDVDSGSPVTDHGSLSGLGDNDHTQYALVAGDTFTGDVTVEGVLRDTATITSKTSSYTLVLTDRGKLVEMNKSTALTLTVPPNSSVAFPVGTRIDVIQTGAGQLTFAPGSGVTLNGTPGLKARAQWSAASLIKRGTDTWVVVGDLSS